MGGGTGDQASTPTAPHPLTRTSMTGMIGLPIPHGQVQRVLHRDADTAASSSAIIRTIHTIHTIHTIRTTAATTDTQEVKSCTDPHTRLDACCPTITTTTTTPAAETSSRTDDPPTTAESPGTATQPTTQVPTTTASSSPAPTPTPTPTTTTTTP